MRTTRYDLQLILRLTNWAHILAWTLLLLACVVALLWAALGVYTILHPAITAGRCPQLPIDGPCPDLVLQEFVRVVQAVGTGLVSFVFLKGISEALFILVDFEENTRPEDRETPQPLVNS